MVIHKSASELMRFDLGSIYILTHNSHKGGFHMSKRIITIGREFGSNGRKIGAALAERLGIHCYDKDLISLAAEQTGIPYEQLKLVDEKREKPWAYQVDLTSGLSRQYRYAQLDEKLFKAQSDVIRRLAETEDCIIVGRCADYILKDVKTSRHVFLYAPYDIRVGNIIERYTLDPKSAEKLMRRVDKDRSYYYNYYTDKYWDEPESYDYCFNTCSQPQEELLDILEFIFKSL